MQFLIDGNEYNVQALGEEAMECAQRMTELQDDLTTLQQREKEIMALLNFYALTIKSIANPEPAIEVVN